jgi:hypothetical protein
LRPPHLQNNQSKKWTTDVAQAVQCLLWKCKALSSNPSPTKKKKKGEKEEEEIKESFLPWMIHKV